MTDLHAVADVLTVPSTWSDPGPLSVIEAAASGTLLVASATGGVPELLPEKAQGLLVPPGDPTALADRLRELRSMPEDDRVRLRRVIRAHAEAQHDITDMIDRVEAVLVEAVEEPA